MNFFKFLGNCALYAALLIIGVSNFMASWVVMCSRMKTIILNPSFRDSTSLHLVISEEFSWVFH